MMTLNQLFIHPIKSLTGLSVNNADITPLGLAGDRMMMIVDESGKFITQRTHPNLANITISQDDQAVTLSSQDQPSIKINKDSFQTDEKQVEVWGDICHAQIANAELNQWFCEFLGFSAFLVNYQSDKPRPVDANYAKPGDHVSFADGFPLLVASQASLDELNSRLETPVTMRNFRPNLVVSGGEPYAEDNWKQITVGDVTFDVVKPCTRCVLTTVDPATGLKREDKEPLKTLSQFRRAPGGVMFGMNLIPRSLGSIALGDPVKIID